MANSEQKIAGIVLCGGHSSRMGVDKSELLFNGQPLLKHMETLLQNAGVAKILLAGRGEIQDIIPNRGPLGGIHAVIDELNDTCSHLLIVPVDMPLLTSELLQNLSDNINDSEATHYMDHIMPLKLATSQNVKNIIAELINQPDTHKTSVKELLSRLVVKTLPIHTDKSYLFDNTNTPEDWQRVTGSKI